MSAGPMRFPSRGRWVLWLILLFALGPFLLILPASLWLGWTMNPVQTYYLGTYTACSILSGYPGAMTTVRYAEKTAPGRKPEPLLPEDAVKGSDPRQPLALGPKALAEGWRAVAIAPPGKVRAKELQAYLQTTVYDGDSAWAIFLRPICYVLAGVVFLYALWFQFGRRSRFSRKQEQRHGRRTKGPELLSRLHGSGDGGIRFQMEREGIFGQLATGVAASISRDDWRPAISCSWATPAPARVRRSDSFFVRSKTGVRAPLSMTQQWTFWVSSITPKEAT